MPCYCDAVRELEGFLDGELAEIGAGTRQGPRLNLDQEPAPSHDRKRFEVVYSAGRMSTLPAETAQQFVEHEMSRVRPGGAMLLANLSEDSGIATCGLCGMLTLHPRTAESMAELTSALSSGEVSGQVLYGDPQGRFVCLEIHKQVAA
jgi:hypothetical protein